MRAVALAMLLALPADTPAFAQSEHMHHLGSHVMPFDLARSRHIFQNLPDGGVMEIVSLDGDLAQIERIRGHLRKEAAAFQRGDFSDPISIHGTSMPGLAALHEGASRLSVSYEDALKGARLRFATADPNLLRALRLWFAAQVHDHGPDAVIRP